MPIRKQDGILGLKQGFFSSSEGRENDIGVCVKNGIHYLGIKAQNKWQYTELKKDVALKDSDIINQSFSKTIKNQFEFYLNHFSTTIRNIINARAPRVYSFPFSLIVYEDAAAGTNAFPTVIGSSLNGLELITDLLNDNTNYVSNTFNSLVPLPLKCKMQSIYLNVIHKSGGSDDRSDARIGFAIDLMKHDGTIATISVAAKAPTQTWSSTSYSSWDFENISNAVIPANGAVQAVCLISVDPTNRKVYGVNGVMNFEEVL